MNKATVELINKKSSFEKAIKTQISVKYIQERRYSFSLKKKKDIRIHNQRLYK